jgi:serine/threonine-protein kinase
MLALTLGGVYAVASDPPSGIDAPDVLGRGVDAARDDVLELARRDGLPAPKVKIVDRQYSESVPAGRIIQQDPAPGTRITSGGALLLAVSKGSAYAPVPSVAGLESSRAVATLERAGFVTARKFSPSREIAAWHAIDTDPAPDTRVKRPATVTILVSTGPPRVAIPQVRGLDVETAAETLREAGFVPVVEERASGEAPGAILGLRPAGGTRIPVGSTVTIVVAREPVWTAVTELTGEGSTTFDQITIPAGSRLRIETDDTSFLDLAGARLSVTWVGDANGGLDLDGGDGAVLVDAGHSARTVEVTLTAEGPVRWRLVVEEPR